MADGGSKAKVHDVFKNRLDDLTSQAEEQAKAVTGEGTRPWQVPNDFEAENLQDVPNLHEPSFNRDELNTQYNETIQAAGEEAGTLGDTIGLKQQISYTAAQERAFRLRHASPVRLLAHAAGIREAHGNTKGVFGGVQKMVEDVIRAGGNS